MKVAALLFLAAALAAPAAAATGPGVFGHVTRGPIRPVCSSEEPCDAPAPGVTLVFSRGGHEVARTRTGSDGSYRLRLAPGIYAVRTLGRIFRPLKPATATVPVGRYARVDFAIDTGIR